MTNTTQLLDAVAWGRAPRPPGRLINRRIVCADDFRVSVQASDMHYANDMGDEAPYWRGADPEIKYPFVTFELGGMSDEVTSKILDEYDAGGVWAWVPRGVVAAFLDSHGGAVGWEDPK